jgi:hypothetical protein
MKKWSFVALLVVGATILGATVLREPIARAAQTVDATIVGPLDGQGNVKVHEQGTANVNVTNTAQVQAAIPAEAFSFVGGVPSVGDAKISGPDPAGTNYAITSFTISNFADTPQVAFLAAVYGTTVDCVNFSGFDTRAGPQIEVPPHDTVHVDFPQPFVIAAKFGSDACLMAGGSGGGIAVVGYRS